MTTCRAKIIMFCKNIWLETNYRKPIMQVVIVRPLPAVRYTPVPKKTNNKGPWMYGKKLTSRDPEWWQNYTSTRCLGCKKKFSYFCCPIRWRHHCRSCGKPMCDDCAPLDTRVDARRCTDCFLRPVNT